jgi:hypothetical protein
VRSIVCAGVMLVAIGGVARPQPIATEPGAVPAIAAPEPATGGGAIVGVIGGGVADAKDISGTAWVARFEVLAFPLFARKDKPGPILGFGYGFEYWRAGPDNWGLALPAGIQVGARVGPAHGVIGLGIHALVVDQVEDDTGVGSYSPYASAALAFHVGKATMVIDGRIDHRFLYGAADRTQWSLGVMFGVIDETAFRRKRNARPYY